MGVTPIDPDVQKLIKFSPARICCSLCRHIRSYAKINPDGHLVVKLEWALLHRGDTRLAVPLPAIATLERTGQAAQTSPLTFVAVRLAAGVHPKVAIEHLGHNRVGMS
jgi:hypothetical protein